MILSRAACSNSFRAEIILVSGVGDNLPPFSPLESTPGRPTLLYYSDCRDTTEKGIYDPSTNTNDFFDIIINLRYFLSENEREG
jgi:hypothetical protein